MICTLAAAAILASNGGTAASPAASAPPAVSGVASVSGVAGPAAPVPPASFVAIPGDREFTGELIVRPRQDLTAAQRKAAMTVVQPLSRRYIPQTDEFMVVAARAPELFGAPENRVAAQLMATGLFQYAHPNWLVFPTVVPNDTRFGDQWHHTMVRSPQAWDLHTGSSTTVVAVADTGIVTHEDLPNRVPGFNAVSHVAEVDGGDLTDINGHGTHVAGCAAAKGNNALGVSGMGWNLSIMPTRVSEAPGGGASYEAIFDAVRWAAEHGAVCASASYSGVGYDAQETTGIYMNGLGCSFLWAAGNSAMDQAGFDYDHVLVIGASDQSDNRAGFSGFGRGVDCFAPGVSILSTINSGGYGFASGTSMATPVANGVLGMIRSANPALTLKHAEHILLHTCDTWGTEQDNEQFGFGRVNLFNAVKDAQQAFVPAAPIAKNDRVKGVTGTTFMVDVLNNDYDRNMDALQVLSVPAVTSMGDPVSIMPGAGTNGRDLVRVQVNYGVQPGTRSFTYTMREPISGATAQASVAVEVVGVRSPENPIGTQPGLAAKYYSVAEMTALPNFGALAPFLTEVVPSINYPSTDGAFAGSGLSDDVAATFDGWLRVPQSGLWTINIQSDDGSKLVIGTNAINNDGLHGMTTKSLTLPLAAGRHQLHVEFFERGGGAGLIVSWSGPGTTTQAIPSDAFSHGGFPLPADLNGDGIVDGADLGRLLGAWGATGVPEDLDGNGVVDGADLGQLLGWWTT